MKAITIRGIDEETSSRLKQIAKRENKSVNKLVLEMIEQRTGMKKKRKRIYQDLDHLFGRWTDKEFHEIQEEIDSQRKIDRELWR